MNYQDTGGSGAVDLTNCDREPIHIPGSIQPFGFLLALNGDWVVERAANTQPFMDIDPRGLIGMSAATIFLPQAITLLRERLSALRGEDAVERMFSVRLMADKPKFDVALHLSGRSIVIECEPAKGDEIEVSSMVRGMVARLGATEQVSAILREGARQLRMLTGFDRVKVYRFDPDGSGEVVAEALEPGVDSFLGLHFPASDIPQQARALYVRNFFRIIADVSDTPCPVEPVERAEPLDLSMSLFRAVSPIHIEYLRNMGVGASLSVSIVVDGKFWGLFACHHYAPRLPSFAERSAAELFGQMFSLLLGNALRKEAGEYEDRARKISERLLAAAAQDAARLNDAEWIGDIVLDAIPADGVGVVIDGSVSMSGLTPTQDEFERIVRELERREVGQIYTTQRIADILPDAAEFAHKAAGMLAIPVSRRPRDYVVLFRAEQLRSVRWAGNQAKNIEYGPNGPRLTPRQSFEEWSNLVRGEAKRFEEAEIRVAEALRTSLLEVVLRLTEAASEERRRAGEQQKLLIAELNHRVRNILALIRALIGQTNREVASVRDFVGTLDSRVQSLARAHDQLTAEQWGPGRLKELISTEASAYLSGAEQRLVVEGPDVTITPSAFTVMALVVHELVTNAAKYGALSDGGTVTVGWSLDGDRNLAIRWEESGGPAVTAPTRRGFGTTIIHDSIPHELGGAASVEYRTAGLLAQFTLPGRHVAGVVEGSEARIESKAAPRNEGSVIVGRHVLLVEDSALIALDAEDKLRELGAAEVTLASTNAAAAAALDDGGIELAMLDFNLGKENSLPTATRLKNEAIPFVFASGYGGDDTIPAEFADIPVILKPYASQQIAEALAQLPPPAGD
ncbi:HWE histidine kinase domain-containing protein [Croceicoccus sp. Ery5]|uniref:HWE histidine kinase domain-containing protein n=1 Tax=Croceicoccus sp. Ery5 TaxID=1703340 RepID=UPI001E391628|nr:HWE histidine kinase domain-containing protein [Croceicoccus sp. Ery5]